MKTYLLCLLLNVHLVKMFICSPWIPYTEGVGQLGPSIWFNPHKPGPKSKALCGAMCALSIAIVIY